MTDIDDYSTQYAAQYAAESFEPVLVAARRRLVLDVVQRYASRRMLEIGCGLEPLFQHIGETDRYVVVEPSPSFVAEARRRAEQRPEVDVRQGFFEDVAPDLIDGAFDLVIVSSLLHEVPDPARLLAAIRSIAGPETIVHFNVPNVRSFHRLLALEMGIIDSLLEPSELERRFQRTTRFDMQRLTEMLAAGGFAPVRQGSYFVKPFTHAQMAQMLATGIIDARVLAGLERMTRHLPDAGCEIFVDAGIA